MRRLPFIQAHAKSPVLSPYSEKRRYKSMQHILPSFILTKVIEMLLDELNSHDSGGYIIYHVTEFR